jgi:putative transposase
MRAGGVFCRPKRRFQATTDSTHSERRFENLLPTVVPKPPNPVWQVDLTDVRVKHGVVYLACVLDSFTREIVGWAMSRCIDVD